MKRQRPPFSDRALAAFGTLSPEAQASILNIIASYGGLARNALLNTPEQRKAERDARRQWARWERTGKALDARQARLDKQITALYDRRSKRTSQTRRSEPVPR